MLESSAALDPALAFRDATVAYGRDAPTLRGVSLEVARGELHVLLGPSGSGKTTLLRAAAGFEALRSGTLHLAGRLVDDGTPARRVPPEARGIGYVFQDYALFPDRTVSGNIAFPMAKPDPARVAALVAQVGLGPVAGRLPAELSGGQQQRVALARALARSPELMLLDEPFSNIDKSLRRTLRETTLGVIRETGLAALFVTHDAEEAMALADRLTVLSGGRILQTGDAVTLYRRPVDLEVARTFGDVALLPASSRAQGGVETPLGALAVEGGAGNGLLLRPEDFTVRAAEPTEANATLERVTFLGSSSELRLRMGDHGVIPARVRPEEAPAVGPVRVEVRRPGWLVDRRAGLATGPVLTTSQT